MKYELIQYGKEHIISVKEDTLFIINSDNTKLHLKFEKPEVEAQVIALYKKYSSQNTELITIAEHIAPHTKCITSVRGVLLDQASSNYIGKIIIQKSAQQTVSYLDDKVLLVGEGAKNSSQPILQIEADDVKASHGATTGNIDSDQLYYLQSRGLSADEAREVIIDGFFEELLSKIEDQEILRKIKL